jgi:hypothetical protein
MSEIPPVASAGHLPEPPTPDSGAGYISDPPVRGPEGFISDPPVRGPDGFISDPRVRAPGETFISDPPATPRDEFISNPRPADQFLGSPAPSHEPGQSGRRRGEFSTTDHLLSAANNVGNFFEDLWDKNYGEAVVDAGHVVMDTGSALYAALFGDRTPKT